MAAQRRQAGLQVAVLELGNPRFDFAQGGNDAAAHAQGEHGCQGQTADDQQQAGEQAAVAAEQGALMRKLQLDPAEQLEVGFIGLIVA